MCSPWPKCDLPSMREPTDSLLTAACLFRFADLQTLRNQAFSLMVPEALSTELFDLPHSYRFVARSEAQKTASRTKKRMLIANLAL